MNNMEDPQQSYYEKNGRCYWSQLIFPDKNADNPIDYFIYGEHYRFCVAACLKDNVWHVRVYRWKLNKETNFYDLNAKKIAIPMAILGKIIAQMDEAYEYIRGHSCLAY